MRKQFENGPFKVQAFCTRPRRCRKRSSNGKSRRNGPDKRPNRGKSSISSCTRPLAHLDPKTVTNHPYVFHEVSLCTTQTRGETAFCVAWDSVDATSVCRISDRSSGHLPRWV